ncbi:MAG: sigma-54-dependent Fis family transcriptional regulator [Planctomycetes bacterium]|nr:sigma-54-dependent Fis family transcriptional regulator [Planctomycetota bacterium]
MQGRILIVDDDTAMGEMLSKDLARRGFEARAFSRADDAFAALHAGEYDVVLTDLKMPDTDGISLCRRILENRPDVLVVALTGFATVETAVEALRAGAFDFVTKPVDLDVLAHALDRAVRHRELLKKVTLLSRAVEEGQRFDELIGASQPMKELYDMMERVAPSEASVLLTGESGTGKELVARALHRRGPRHEGPFVPVNCAAVPEALLESELFGHARGAFTDARAARKGLFVQATGGTLFLDEIGDMPLALQAKILRALDEGRVRPVGSDEIVDFDARLIAATNRDIESAVEEGRFREDLYYRIDVIHISLPPLRDRGADVLLLAKRFVDRFAALSGKTVIDIATPAAERLLAYPWPGNVRELRNCIERAVALTRYDRIAVEDLPAKIADHADRSPLAESANPSEMVSMEEVERRYIAHVLRTVGGNKSVAARILGLDRKTLYRKVERYGLAKESTQRDDP